MPAVCASTSQVVKTPSRPPAALTSAAPRPPATWAARVAALAATATLVLGAPGAALAVSGGGGDLQNASFQDLSGQDFRGKKLYKTMLRGTKFDGADLTGASLFGSFAKGASFVGARLDNADLESVDFDGADLTNAVLAGAQMTNAQLGAVKSIEGADFTDAILRRDAQKALCSVARGTNPATGVDTRESLLCP